MTASASRLDIEVQSAGVLTLRGDIDAHTAGQLEAALLDVHDEDEVHLHMAEVAFLDSSGLRVVLAAHRRLAEDGRELIVDRPSDVVTRLLEITGLQDHLRIE